MFIDRNVALPNNQATSSTIWNFANVLNIVVNMAATGFGILLAPPTAAEPDRLAVPGRRLRARRLRVRHRVRAPRPGGGPRLVAGGTGGRVAVQLDGADPARRALLPLHPVPDRSSSIGEVASGSLVRGRRLHARHGVLPRLLDHDVERPVRPILVRRLIGLLVVGAPSPADRLVARGIPRGGGRAVPGVVRGGAAAAEMVRNRSGLRRGGAHPDVRVDRPRVAGAPEPGVRGPVHRGRRIGPEVPPLRHRRRHQQDGRLRDRSPRSSPPSTSRSWWGWAPRSGRRTTRS